ncbi:hypothetical protein QBC38DRAFT_53352 [Podospora fimiseda]|uniref:Uncharacterized protein n=1 Tax=Podospora fimiseda TaxID=252190 RepID=A0AAN7GUD7_9PEZI|nr:hypothetical protein QBC38DRAFT_53352 [Podospora fimiseda]
MNSQQDQFIAGAGFSMVPPNNNNRSPGARLTSFASHSFSSLRPHASQRQMENAAQLSTTQYSAGNDSDRFNTVDSSFRHAARTQQNAGGYGGDGYMSNSNNLASWPYNGGANTVNGALGESRLRSGARRANIPTEWLTSDPSGLGSQALNTPSTQYTTMYSQLSMLNGGDSSFGDRQGYQNMFDHRHEAKALGSDLIPTAIVIKNIPFNVRKEMLTQIMSELNLPQPYAFNYHFDNGIFRGLAFANFQSPIDTQTVIEQLNGYEVQGRKLRVEYKKMLPEHERERIEREKREKRGQLEEQHQPITLHSQTSMHSLNAAHSTRSRASPLRKSSTKSTMKLAPTSTNSATLAGDVDLNNPETLSFYTELTLFKNDNAREIIIFPSTITPTQRRTVHILAHNMGLEHHSVGEGAERQIHVCKENVTSQTLHPLGPGVSADAHRRGLSRAATIDFAETRTSVPGQYATLGRSTRGPTLELPDSPDGGLNALRGVKSFADLRSYTPSPSLSSSGFPGNTHAANVAQYGEYSSNVTGHTSSMTTPTTPGANSNNDPSMLIQDLGSMSLSDQFNGGRLRPREAAPGAIGSQRPGLNGNSTRSVPERQPLGPNNDWNDGVSSVGFSSRTRTNGHMQRGSDSSDAAVRAALSSASSRFQ